MSSTLAVLGLVVVLALGRPREHRRRAKRNLRRTGR